MVNVSTCGCPCHRYGNMAHLVACCPQVGKLFQPTAVDLQAPVRAAAKRITDLEAERTALQARVAQLEDAIRKHRDQRGDDRCWMDDDELYDVLPPAEYTDPRARRLCEPAVMLENCKRFIASRHNPDMPYVSPQRTVERLEAKVKELEALLGRGP